ncbi:SRPBCC family protein [Cellulomonas sp. H30R-01]|nr:SRPBCC family protein [Cellulomonas sp. H30R-01]
MRLLRAVDVAAPADVAFAWLCQLRLAPYSYDLLDNGGRRSPRTRTVDPEDLVPGTTMMQIFELTSVAPGEHLTMRIVDRRALAVFGPVTVTYAVHADAPGRSRYVAVLRIGSPRRGRLVSVGRALLAWGDLVMMRKQLLTLAALAGREAREVRGVSRATGRR